MRRRQGTIKDWIIYSKSKGIDLSYLDSDKNLDLQKLAGSGLPIFDLFSCSYSSFLANDPKLVDFLFRYSGFVVRAIPKLGENLPRRYKIGITNFQEASSFLEEQARGNEKRYNVALTEWEPAIFSGVVQ